MRSLQPACLVSLLSFITRWTDPVRHQIVRDLEQARFPEAEMDAVQRTAPMWAQLTRFYGQGGRVVGVPADFAGANGSPDQIRFYCPADPAQCVHSTYGALAHELGHALSCPEQWLDIARFPSAEAYADSREMGEAHAWLNQYRLCQAKVGGRPEGSCVLDIENDHDFGTRTVDMYAHIAARELAGWSEAQILEELATFNANMFPCGMGEGNYKTYGQCNRWDWLVARQDCQPAFTAFLQAMGRPATPNDQKVLMKFNLFTGSGTPPADAALPAGLQALAHALQQPPQQDGLDTLYALARCQMPDAVTGVEAGRAMCRVPAGAADMPAA